MSYILDALKKADRERRPVAVPTLGSVHQPPTPSRLRALWPWIAGAVIIGNVGVWLWLPRSIPVVPDGSKSTTPATPAARTPEQATPPRPAEEAAAPARREEPRVAALPSPSTPSPMPPSPSREKSAALVRPAETKPTIPAPAVPNASSAESQRPPRTDAPPATPVPAGEAAGRTASLAKPAPGAVPSPQPPAVPEKSPAPPAPSTAPRPPERSATPVPAPPESVPPDVAGKLTLQVLVYSTVPSERMVFINNQKYLEGQQIDANLIVESITPDGAVLSYQGKRLVLRSDQPGAR